MTAIYRILRVLVAQGIGMVVETWGGVLVPYLGITIGALLNGFFKFLREKFPNSGILAWLPL